MIVSELIENLQKLQQDLPVLVYDGDWCIYRHVVLVEVETVAVEVRANKIFLFNDYQDGSQTMPVIRLFTDTIDS